MSPRLKRLSGDDVVAIFQRLGFRTVRQTGSHVKLVRVTPRGERQVLTVPKHKELDKGTLQAIYRQAMRFIDEETLRSHFCSE